MKSETLKTGNKLLCDGKSLKRKTPIVKRRFQGWQENFDFADVTARSEQELEENMFIYPADAMTYPAAWRPFRTCTQARPKPNEWWWSTTPCSVERFQKIAYGFTCTKLPESVIFSFGVWDDSAIYKKIWCACSCLRQLSPYRISWTDNVRPIHKIHVALNAVGGFLWAMCRCSVSTASLSCLQRVLRANLNGLVLIIYFWPGSPRADRRQWQFPGSAAYQREYPAPKTV